MLPGLIPLQVQGNHGYTNHGHNNVSIFDAYKGAFDNLKSKGFKPKLNVTDNQATKYIKKFLTKKKFKLQLVKPHNK
jgi:hypothetical protein